VRELSVEHKKREDEDSFIRMGDYSDAVGLFWLRREKKRPNARRQDGGVRGLRGGGGEKRGGEEGALSQLES